MQICLVLLHGVYELSEFLVVASESHKKKYGKSTDHVHWELCCAC